MDDDRDDEQMLAEEPLPKSGQEQKQHSDLKGLTQASSAQEKELDVSKAQKAIINLGVNTRDTNKSTIAEQLKALSSVKIKNEDVEFLQNELELSREQAELLLRQNDGVLLNAIRSFLKT
jgi:NACalpha-BTF3-like transcription factor